MNATPTASIIVGIDDMSAYIPSLYCSIEALAQARNIEYAKLNKGLGLESMAIADHHEDAATMAANAVLDLMLKNNLSPQQIGRIYVGTESAIDGAKPMASYALEMLTDYFAKAHGPDSFLNCDVVDMTFACIGAVDAMQNTLDWVKGSPERIGIVVGTDIAKYELESGGEYTQGAGAVALLLRQKPRLLAISDHWGVAARGVHDFFKPVREVSKKQIIEEVLQLAGIDTNRTDELLNRLQENLQVNGILDSNEKTITIHKDMPVFDGPYSNSCYQDRIGEALDHFRRQLHLRGDEATTDRWARILFHLPYAFQARRMFSEVFMEESKRNGTWNGLETELGMTAPQEDQYEDQKAYRKAWSQYLRAITKMPSYRAFVAERIEKSERASSLVGNLYTSSIFLGLMSSLEADLHEEAAISGRRFGFFAYGSGSKSKVFEGILQTGWKEIVQRFGLMQFLNQRQEISYDEYEQLHRLQSVENVGPKVGFYLAEVCQEAGDQYGARTYKWAAKVPVTVSVES